MFTQAFVDAMHPAMALPIAVLCLGGSATMLVRGSHQAKVAHAEEEAAVA